MANPRVKIYAGDTYIVRLTSEDGKNFKEQGNENIFAAPSIFYRDGKYWLTTENTALASILPNGPLFNHRFVISWENVYMKKQSQNR